MPGSQPGDFGFEGVDAFGMFGDEQVGVEKLADELDEELEIQMFRVGFLAIAKNELGLTAAETDGRRPPPLSSS